jgi:peptidoglycan-associated lipoprotein
MQTHLAGRGIRLTAAAILLLTAAGCAKKPPSTPPPPPPPVVAPPPARPTVTLQASPTFIQQGENTTLSWSSTNATELNLAGVGRVAPEGSTKVSPGESTTYAITANGPGGNAEASVRVTVSPPPPPPPPTQPSATLEELFRTNVQDAYFDYDKSDIRPDARDALARTAEFLRAYAQIKVTVEGHCDERGSTEYNLGLGEKRAQATRQFLVSLGVPPDRMTTVSLGKERPFCTDSNETCWQKNRRGHFVLAGR